MMATDEFSPEQTVVIELLRPIGTSNPEAIVRSDRLSAYRLGAHLTPVLERMAAALAGSIEALLRGRP